jgi:hypothetical protein
MSAETGQDSRKIQVLQRKGQVEGGNTEDAEIFEAHPEQLMAKKGGDLGGVQDAPPADTRHETCERYGATRRAQS